MKKEIKNKVLLPFRWAGGKYYALSKLSQFWENFEHDEYREPFLGGGAVFWAKPKSQFNWLNDIDDGLIRTLEFIKDSKNREKLLKLFENEKEATRETHAKVKKIEPKSELEFVYKYYYLNRTSFSGKMKNPSWGYRPKRSLPPHRWKERIIPCSEKLSDTKLTNLDFSDVILEKAAGKKVLIFLDPPYYHAKQESHYAFSFKDKDHERLAKVCKKTKHNFFLTYDDCPEIRKMYSWANIFSLQFYYRLDNSKDNGNKRKIGSELVITNYKPDNLDEKLLKHAIKID
jgi:DNA adenine methylase